MGRDAERRVDDDGLGAAIDHFPRSSEYTRDQYTLCLAWKKDDGEQAAAELEKFGKKRTFFYPTTLTGKEQLYVTGRRPGKEMELGRDWTVAGRGLLRQQAGNGAFLGDKSRQKQQGRARDKPPGSPLASIAVIIEEKNARQRDKYLHIIDSLDGIVPAIRSTRAVVFFCQVSKVGNPCTHR